jgi:hypothetical protein
MPGVNHVALASAGLIAVSVAVATAIAIYESPEVRRYADDIRRRIAIALHSLGDGIDPEEQEPRFNRPEDAEGFMQSRSGMGAEPGVDADDETRRRQREELMYWNALRLQKQEKEQKEAEAKAIRRSTTRGSSFDDFLQQDESAERGTYVFNTGAEYHGQEEGLVRRRVDGVRGLNSAVYANPFSDEHQIEHDELPVMESNILSPGQDEIFSDIYSATTRDPDERQTATLEPSPPLVDLSHSMTTDTEPAFGINRELAPNEYMTAGQEEPNEAYASIQAWAQGSSPNFYSPLPMSPASPVSEPELISDGELTPTDSVSLAGSGEDVGNDTTSFRDGASGRLYDVLSESDGMATPASWSEVGSVVSENDHVPVHA